MLQQHIKSDPKETDSREKKLQMRYRMYNMQQASNISYVRITQEQRILSVEGNGMTSSGAHAMQERRSSARTSWLDPQRGTGRTS